MPDDSATGPTRRPIRPGAPAPDEPSGRVPESLYREALSHWASGVTVIAVREESRVYATTATAFASASLRPPLVLFVLGAGAQALPFLAPGRACAISILAEAQRRYATIFADAFPVGPSPFPATGPPVIPGALVVLQCEIEKAIEAGDHHIFIARVAHAEIGPDAPPLVHYRREYPRLRGG